MRGAATIVGVAAEDVGVTLAEGGSSWGAIEISGRGGSLATTEGKVDGWKVSAAALTGSEFGDPGSPNEGNAAPEVTWFGALVRDIQPPAATSNTTVADT